MASDRRTTAAHHPAHPLATCLRASTRWSRRCRRARSGAGAVGRARWPMRSSSAGRSARALALRDGWAVRSELTSGCQLLHTGAVAGPGAGRRGRGAARRPTRWRRWKSSWRDGRRRGDRAGDARRRRAAGGRDARQTCCCAAASGSADAGAILAAAGIGRVRIREPRMRMVRARAGRDAVHRCRLCADRRRHRSGRRGGRGRRCAGGRGKPARSRTA